MPTRRAPLGSSAMARNARPGRVRYRRKKKQATATIPTARDHTCPETTLIRPTRMSGSSLARLSGNAMARPWLKEWDSTSVMIIPIPIERTIVLLMSTSPLFAMTFWNRGADTRLSATEEATPASMPSTKLSPVSRRTTQAMYMENTTTWG